MTTTADDVYWCYREILGREPESLAVVAAFVERCPDRRALVREFCESAERRRQLGLAGLGSPDIWLYHRTKWGWLFPVCLGPQFLAAHVPVYEEAETDFVVSQLRPGDQAVDMGARYGWFTCAMAAAVGPGGRVMAFDPNPEAPGYITRASRANGWQNVYTVCAGLGERNGEALLREDSTVAPVDEAASLPRISLVRLDDALRGRTVPVRLIKCDIEGSELFALRGGLEVLREDRPVLLIEVNDELARRVTGEGFEAVYRLLVDLGYGFAGLDGVALGWDGLAARIENREIFNVVSTKEG